MPDYEYENTINQRSFDMRTRETGNWSFSSGDSAQAALLSFYI